MFDFKCPTATRWREIAEAQRVELTNPRHEMKALLAAVQEDVYEQFDANQKKWTPLADYTIEKKTANRKDLRILHETKEGEGLRLRDAYREAGKVTEQGLLIYSYPESKPYAKEHQEGSGQPDKKKKSISYKIYEELGEFDDEFLRKIGKKK